MVLSEAGEFTKQLCDLQSEMKTIWEELQAVNLVSFGISCGARTIDSYTPE